MKIAEIREKSDVELQRLLGELRDRIQDQRFKIASRQMSVVSDVKKAKKDVARILTEIAARKAKSTTK